MSKILNVGSAVLLLLLSVTASLPTIAAQEGAETANHSNSLGMRFARVPITGGPTDGLVVYFSIWETRAKDVEVFVAATGQDWKATRAQLPGDHPAAALSWKQAKLFCRWLTERERGLGKISSKDLYRLPSDHEWSCAAGIGKKEDPQADPISKNRKVVGYPWGNYFPPGKKDGNYKWNVDDGFDSTAPVGSFAANAFGLHDIGGNLMELCEDFFPKPGDSVTYCVVRDAPFAFGNPAKPREKDGLLFTSHRSWQDISKEHGWKGFRVVFEPGGADRIGEEKLPPSITAKRVGNGKVAVRKNLTKVNGLLVLALGGTKHAGKASPMTLTSIGSDSPRRASLSFNQKVGSTMETALGEVAKFIEVRHGGWPKGREMEISFENKYNPKDGPSAAVACALLLESAFTGAAMDPEFAVTGDMNSDGSVQPIGGVEAKLRGAENLECDVVAIPAKNAMAISDQVLMDGFEQILEIQVFTISDFEEALGLARQNKREDLQQALQEFETIQNVFRQNPSRFNGFLRHPTMIAKLEGILAVAPHHLSAGILLAIAQGRAPDTLSLHGSFSFIDRNTFQILSVIDESGKVSDTVKLDDDQLAATLSTLRRNKLKLDKRTWDWVQHLLDFGKLLREMQNNRPSSVSNFNKLVRSINDKGAIVRKSREDLLSTPEVVEDLLE